jgi:hypothetical protein
VTASAPIHAAHAERIVRSHPSRFIQEPSHGARGAASSGSIARLPREDLVARSSSGQLASSRPGRLTMPTPQTFTSMMRRTGDRVAEPARPIADAGSSWRCCALSDVVGATLMRGRSVLVRGAWASRARSGDDRLTGAVRRAEVRFSLFERCTVARRAGSPTIRAGMRRTLCGRTSRPRCCGASRSMHLSWRPSCEFGC